MNHRLGLLFLAGLAPLPLLAPAQKPADPVGDYAAVARPLVQKYCLDCHSAKAKKGDLDLERFATVADVRKDLKPWQHAIEQIEAGEMPPKSRPQLTDDEKTRLLGWIRAFLDAEARARVGDPGHVPLRRLSNFEYDATIRELTGVDLRPTREFPADGAAGEGFTNAAEALGDVSPALLTKYLHAAREVAGYAVLVPDGFRFSAGKTRRDWTDENVARLRRFYADYSTDGKIALAPYVLATIRHRAALTEKKTTPEEVARTEKLNPKYLATLWRTLTDATPSEPLDALRAAWSKAAEKDVPALVGEIAAWQGVLFRTANVGNYLLKTPTGYGEALTRQVPVDPAVAESQPVRLAVKPTPGQGDVTLYLTAVERSPADGAKIVWGRPRLEGPGKPPLLLRDAARWSAGFDADLPTAFVGSTKYLAAVAELAHDPKITAADVAKRDGLDAGFLARWVEVVALVPSTPGAASAVALEPLDEKSPPNPQWPAIRGWRKKGTDLPTVLTNASDNELQIPGRIPAHGVGVHPMPEEFVAVVWRSPVAGTVEVTGNVTHAHPACGNGVAYWLQHRRAGRATLVAEAGIPLGQAAPIAARKVAVEKGDLLVLAVDAKDNNHVCDMTAVAFRVAEVEKPGRVWDLGADVANTVQDGNPHADGHGNKDTWSFVRGPSRPGKLNPNVPAESALGKWRVAAGDVNRRADAAPLAEAVQKLLTGPRPAKENDPDRVLYDKLVGHESPLFRGLDVTTLAKARPRTTPLGLPPERFTAEGDLVADSGTTVEVRLPAGAFAGREFVAEGRLVGEAGERLAQFRVATTPGDRRWDAKAPVVGAPQGPAAKRLRDGYADFRRVFPLFVCFPQVIPTDEVVSLKTFHREDEPLVRLFLDDAAARRLDALWADHRFISRQPAAENDHLEQFIQYVTQDQPKEMLAYFESQRPVFQKRADDFAKEEAAAIPRQFDALLDLAGRAYRRPLTDKESADLRALYKTLRDRGSPHEEAFRTTLARVLVGPAFLFKVEQAAPGKAAGPVNDWELASRLSYFLWSCGPDDELRRLAAAGKLRDPQVLAEQARRMLQDDRLRALAVEFGTQWIHVRGFDTFNEKNEKLFPTFDATLRADLYEEAILFFRDLFRHDRPVTDLLDSDATYLNDRLAKHYGIPGVAGPEWRRVEGVRKFGRGGVLGLGSVQARQAGASRTSPILRGNWVVETLLGEKLPRPPKDVPQLPEVEGADKLTMRQLTEKHVSVASCAACHVRIDPYGFALERYDAIGRLRDKDLGGLPIDARSKLRDGTEFEGLDGLRTYLLTKKKDVVVRLFCQRLLGYALGRSVALSDGPLLDEMLAELKRNDGKLSAAVLAIVRSPQFRTIRGADFGE